MWLHRVSFSFLSLVSVVVKCVVCGMCHSVVFTIHARGPRFPLYLEKKVTDVCACFNICVYILCVHIHVCMYVDT